MSDQIVESKWNPVAVGGNKSNGASGGYNINSYTVSTSWYNKVVANDGSRLARLRNYDEADRVSVEIGRALDILAEDISSSNADNEDQFRIEFEDEDKMKKTTLKLCDSLLEMWQERTEMDDKFFDRVRETLKLGATFYRKNADGSLTELPSERFVGYVLSEDDEDYVTHYIYDKTVTRIDQTGRLYDARTPAQMTQQNEKYETISVDDLLIMKIGNRPFGESIIEKVYGTWKVMKLLEDSVVIYRVTKSHEKRVYYIDVGNLQGPKREQAIEKQRIRLSQKQNTRKGEAITEYDPQSMGESIFIPTNSTGKGSRVETLQGGQQLGEITDVEWFSKKLAAGLRIPHSMIDSNSQEQSQFSDMRVGQMYQIEMRYMGYVKRFARKFQKALAINYRNFAKSREFVIPPEAKFRINDAMSFAMYKELEVQQTRLNVYNGTLQITPLAKKVSMQKYLGFEQDDLIYNEDCKLMEKGIPEKDIKTMERFEIDSIVYGVPSPATKEKYGLPEDNGGF